MSIGEEIPSEQSSTTRGRRTIRGRRTTTRGRRTTRTVQRQRPNRLKIKTHKRTERHSDSSSQTSVDTLGTVSHSDRERVRGTWKDTPFSPTLFSFEEDAGITEHYNVSEDSEELDYFLEFFSHQFINKIVQETNRYHDFLMTTKNFPPHSRMHRWKPTDRNEMYMFFCVIMSMAHVKKHRMKDYWTKSSPLATPAFADMITQDRFFSILTHLHFNDSREHTPGNKLEKIKWVIDHLRSKFTASLKPFQDLCVDESLLLWRGRLSFRQYIPQKRNRFGMKFFVLCDVETGCILDFIVYTGTGTEIKVDKHLGYSGSVVKTLLAPHLDKGHNLYIDSWYTSPKLLKFLQSRRTGACGTVRTDRQMMPVLPDVKRGSSISCHRNNMLCMKWHDKRIVHMLTTLHTDTLIDTGKKDHITGASIKKPACVVDYTQKMRLVDKADMLISSIQCVRKTLKWYKKLFFHMLDMCMLNSYYMYLVKTGKKPPLLDFSLTVIRQMIVRFGRPTAIARPGRSSSGGTNPIRLSARHFPSAVPATQGNPRPRRKCHVCRHTERRERRRQSTHWMCADCGVALCLPDCFRDYHTRVHF